MTAPSLVVDARHLDHAPTGVGVWLRSILAEWSTMDDAAAVALLTRSSSAPDGMKVTPVAAPSVLWHVVAAWRTRRWRARYLSPDSFIVPILLGRRATLVIHDLTPVLLPDAHTRRTRVSHGVLLRLAVRRAGAVVVPSEATASDLARVLRSAQPHVRVIREAARTLPTPTGPVMETPFVLYVGTVEPRKNVDVLVRAFGRVAPDEWRLVIAGKLGWLSDDARVSLQRDIDGDARTRHLGYVSDAELAALYRDASVFVYPSSHEGFGLPVLEAMSHGVPTITTDDAALAEVAGGAAVCVPLADLERGLEEALAGLIASPDARSELAAKGRRRAEEFSWRAVALDLLDVALS